MLLLLPSLVPRPFPPPVFDRILYAMRIYASLVPRPFPPPVFDRILYAKTEGEGLGERVTCVTSVDVRVDTRGAVPDEES